MIKIDDVIEYKDVKVGTLTICVGEKIKKYRALWFSVLAGVVNGQNTLPSGHYPIRFKIHDGIINNPWVCFNRVFKAPIKPLGKTTYAQMQPFIYIQHTDGTEVGREEWKQVTNILAMYVTEFSLDDPTVNVSPKEFLNKSKDYDLENW